MDLKRIYQMLSNWMRMKRSGMLFIIGKLVKIWTF